MSEERKSHEPDDPVDDLEVGKEEAQDVKGGHIFSRKAGKGQEEYASVKLENVQITSYQVGGSPE